MRVLFAGFLALLGALTLSAAPQDLDRPIIKVETNLVMLPVTVVDRDGALVTGLTRDNFTVYDNGERQPIQLFTSDESPATLGLVIDSSSSMRGRRDQVTAAAMAFATLSHPLDEFFTVNFNDTAWLGLQELSPFAENAGQLQTALTRAPAVGMTALYDAVILALEHLQLGTHDRRALIIVSDGGDNASTATLEHALDLAQRTSSVIYAVILADPDDSEARPAVLKKFARQSGGDAFSPRRPDDVLQAFTQIANEIRSGYTIGFSPPGGAHGEFRAIRVVASAADRRLNARTRAGYYASRR